MKEVISASRHSGYDCDTCELRENKISKLESKLEKLNLLNNELKSEMRKLEFEVSCNKTILDLVKKRLKKQNIVEDQNKFQIQLIEQNTRLLLENSQLKFNFTNLLQKGEFMQ